MVAITSNDSPWPILICLLGNFRVLKAGHPAAIYGNKAEAILCQLALRRGRGMSREMLLDIIWPDQAVPLASQCLNSLIHSLRKTLGDEIHGAPPILHQKGTYRLNVEAGVGVDVALFDDWVKQGDRIAHLGDLSGSLPFYSRAIQVYQGDLIVGTDVNAIIERERLRARFLAVLARIAEYYFSIREYIFCLHYAQQLLEYDPCREDAHRLVMRCYVRQGQRAQSLRQYRLCTDILRAEFDTIPETNTSQLYDQIRLNPDNI